MLKELCLLNGTSGDEKAVRDYIIGKIDGHCEWRVDKLGNLIAEKKGKKTPSGKIMVAAHMDEVGLIVTSVKSDGTLSFSSVGGVDPSVVIGRQVTVGRKSLVGVIGSPAVHNLTADEKEKAPSFSSLYIDIGAKDKAEAEKLVKLGETAYFRSEYTTLGGDRICSKAIDDRAGCALMIDMIRGEIPYDVTFVFTVQEEVGTRGAKTAAFAVEPDYAVVLETTTAADIPSADGEKRVCELGKGAVVSYMDRSTIYDRELYELAFSLAEKNNIPVQTKTMVAGGNDSGAIHTTGNGARTVAVSAPCRYLHSPSCVADKRDIDACGKLALALIGELGKL